MPKLKGAIKKHGSKNQGSTASGRDSEGDDSEEDSEAEEVADLPVTLNVQKGGPRMSVSAEVFGKFNVEKAYVPPVHKKSEQ